MKQHFAVRFKHSMGRVFAATISAFVSSVRHSFVKGTRSLGSRPPPWRRLVVSEASSSESEQISPQSVSASFLQP